MYLVRKSIVSLAFFIIGHDDWDKLEYFINSSVKPMDYDSLYKFSPDKMMSTIVYDFIEK